MKPEEVYTVDSKDRRRATLSREKVIAGALWRRASGGIAVDAPRRLVLCHRRSLTKDERPGLWVATFGGKVQPNEKSDAAAKRELFEEFGVKSDSTRISFFSRHRSKDRKQFEYLFFVFFDSSSCSIEPDANEVELWRWVPIDEVLRCLNNPEWYKYGYEHNMLGKMDHVWKKVESDQSCRCLIGPSDSK